MKSINGATGPYDTSILGFFGRNAYHNVNFGEQKGTYDGSNLQYAPDNATVNQILYNTLGYCYGAEEEYDLDGRGFTIADLANWHTPGGSDDPARMDAITRKFEWLDVDGDGKMEIWENSAYMIVKDELDGKLDGIQDTSKFADSNFFSEMTVAERRQHLQEVAEKYKLEDKSERFLSRQFGDDPILDSRLAQETDEEETDNSFNSLLLLMLFGGSGNDSSMLFALLLFQKLLKASES